MAGRWGSRNMWGNMRTVKWSGNSAGPRGWRSAPGPRGWRNAPGRRGARTNRSRGKALMIVFVLFSAFSFLSFLMVERNLKGPLMSLAKIRVTQIATQSINTAISEQIAKGTSFEQLVQWKTDNNGKVSGFMLNYNEHMKITAATINTVQTLLNDLKAMREHIPLGQVMGSAILGSFGPDVPIKLVPAGAVKVDLNTRYENAGINMILVEVYIKIAAEVAVIIPFDSEPQTVETELPISYLLVVGDTPMYYVDSKGNPIGDSKPLPPSVTLPPSGAAH
ncbi:sporulation protein YunB [Paenibacillus cymbidii]|uniref:sporulation protein YunB n=1 Tax=Paenibacillus cymbidii TaxID=1639034 RepID=UPI001F2A8067|nr:sporulation protein YunB [Paenibacillus cymbidii]